MKNPKLKNVFDYLFGVFTDFQILNERTKVHRKISEEQDVFINRVVDMFEFKAVNEYKIITSRGYIWIENAPFGNGNFYRSIVNSYDYPEDAVFDVLPKYRTRYRLGRITRLLKSGKSFEALELWCKMGGEYDLIIPGYCDWIFRKLGKLERYLNRMLVRFQK